MFDYFNRQKQLIQKLKGSAKVFALMETICFPVSVATISVVLLHSIAVLVWTVSIHFGLRFHIPVLPGCVTYILVAAAVGYLTNYIAIQMLYYPIDAAELNHGESNVDKSIVAREGVALRKSKVVSFSTFGFWTKGLIPRNREKVAAQIGLIAEERFVTPEAIAKLLPKLTGALLTKNDNGKVRGVEIVRQLVSQNREQAAELIRGLLLGFLKNGDKGVVKALVSKIGKSEAVASALTMALLDYLRENPQSVIMAVREMVSSLMQGYARPRRNEADTLFGGIAQVVRGVTGAVIEGVAEIGSSQIESFIESLYNNEERRRGIREKLGQILPKIFDRIGESIVTNPALLGEVVSGDAIDHLVNVKIDDEVFWDDMGERLAPKLEDVITGALEGLSKESITSFVGEGHFIAENIKETIMRMPLLDFYEMLDEVMAEHLGAIQALGFVLGALVGYIQYSIVLLQEGFCAVPCLMLLMPVVAICGLKLFRGGSRGKEKQVR